MISSTSKIQFHKFFWLYAVCLWVLSIFVGTKPITPFMPYGMGVLIAIAIGAFVSWDMWKKRNLSPAGLYALSLCCLLVCAYDAVEGVMHIAAGDNYYWLRSFARIPLTVGYWFSVKWRVWF
jgi:hypothetical protein